MAPSVKHLADNKTLKVLCAKEGNKILGIAPLRKSRRRIFTHFGYDAIEPLAYGHSDYTGIILSDHKAECMQSFLTYLFDQKNWDIMYLNDIPQSSSLINLLKNRDVIQNFSVEKGVICPYLTLPGSTEELLKNLSESFRINLQRYMRKLQRDRGKVNLIEYHETMTLDKAMQIFFRIHQLRWTAKGESGAFKDQAFRNLFMDSAKLLAEKDWLRLYFLTVDNKPAATMFALEYNKKMYYNISGFNPSYSAYGVGNLLILKILEECITKGIEEFDFMQGDEPYKFKWTKKYRTNFNFTFINNKQSARCMEVILNSMNSSPHAVKILSKFSKI